MDGDGPTGPPLYDVPAHSSTARVCPVCLSTELNPQNQCTLRCGHALCNLCLPQLLSPNCPLCRRPIWREEETVDATTPTPWLLDAGTMLMGLEPAAVRSEQTPSSTLDDLSSLATGTAEEEGSADHIPVLLLTRAQLRQIFHR
mgnify:CR=1 FL=1